MGWQLGLYAHRSPCMQHGMTLLIGESLRFSKSTIATVLISPVRKTYRAILTSAPADAPTRSQARALAGAHQALIGYGVDPEQIIITGMPHLGSIIYRSYWTRLRACDDGPGDGR